jgi:hypothetical protein
MLHLGPCPRALLEVLLAGGGLIQEADDDLSVQRLVFGGPKRGAVAGAELAPEAVAPGEDDRWLGQGSGRSRRVARAPVE